MRVLVVGGRFDQDKGKPSGYVAKMADALLELFPKECEWTIGNGGPVSALDWYFQFKGDRMNICDYDVIFWWIDVDNEMPKVVRLIKQCHPKCILVTSKRNFDGVYGYMHLFAHALSNKSNLLVEFTRAGLHHAATILDPLGNCFLMKEADIHKVAEVLADRVMLLACYTRISSERVGYAMENIAPISDEREFFSVAREYAEKFHLLIHTATQERFMGNLSFRCENGFPSYRGKHLVFVSKRNLDKRDIDTNGFVPVYTTDLAKVYYEGDDKPSVDTPVQLVLYQHYPNIRYMLHSHCYLRDVPFTNSVIPCGALEEAEDILAMFPDRNVRGFRVNLLGHGSIVAGVSVEDFEDLPYYARPVPEMQVVKAAS